MNFKNGFLNGDSRSMQVYFDTIPKYRSDGLVLVDKVSDINVKFIQVSLQFRIIMTVLRGEHFASLAHLL